MSLYKPAKSRFWHYDFQYKGRRFHGSTGQTARQKAVAVEAAQREAAGLAVARNSLRPARAPGAVPSLDQAAAEWWEFKGRTLGSPEDEEVRAARLEKAVNWVGRDLLVTDIRTGHIAEAIRRRRGHLVPGPQGTRKVPANATVNRTVIDTIRPVIRRACKLLELPTPPIDWGEVRLAEPKPRPRSFAADDFEHLVATHPIWLQDLVRFQGRYGCRLSELFFRPEDVDVPGRRVRLPDRKGGDDHTIPLVGDDAAMLAARKGRAQAAKLNTVWYRELKSGRLKPLTRGGVLQALRRAMRVSGLHSSQGAKGSHDLRRHAAIGVLRATDNLRATQRLLGHANIASTLVYADVAEGDIRRSLETMLSRNSPEAPLDDQSKSERKQGAK